MSSKILLIDDSITIHRVIDLSIDSTQFEVSKVFSAEDAGSKLKELNPDIILLDNKLENVKTSDFISKIKNETPEARILLLVGAFDKIGEAEVERLGADGFLVKPFNSSSLEEKLNEYTQEAAQSEKIEEESKIEGEEEYSETGTEEQKEGPSIAAESFEDTGLDKEEKEGDFSETFETESETGQTEEEPLSEQEDETAETEAGEMKDEIFGEDSKENIFEDIETEEEAKEESFENIFDDVETKEASSTEMSENVKAEEQTEEPQIDLSEETKEESFEDIFDDLEESEEQSGELSSALDDIIEETAETEQKEVPGEPSSESDRFSPEEEISSETNESLEIGTAYIKEPKAESESKDTDFNKETLVSALKSVMDEYKSELNETMIKNAIKEAFGEDFLKDVVRESLRENLEKVIWEVVPDLSEKLILEEIERLKKGGQENQQNEL